MPIQLVSPAAGQPRHRDRQSADHAGPLRQLWARLRVGELDRALAAGADPSETVDLSLRAQQLLSRTERQRIAATIDRVIERAHQEERRRLLGFSHIPFSHERVRASQVELARLADVLRSSRTLSVQGIARARRLATDFRGPVYVDGRAGELSEAIEDVLTTLGR